MSKTALVISGGGSKGAFAVGVLKYIKENRPDIIFDVVCGTSTGSLITPLAATEEISELEKMYTTTNTEDVLNTGSITDRFLNHTSVFGVKPLRVLVEKEVTDTRYNQIISSGKDIFIAAVCLQTGKVTYFTNSNLPGPSNYDMIRFNSRDEFIKAIVASSDQPVLMPPIDINGKQYVDGGLREYAPMQAAIASGAEEIYAILLSPDLPNTDARTFTSLSDILFRTLALFSEDVSANDILIPKTFSDGIKYINEVKQKILQQSDFTQDEVDELFNTENNPFENRKELNIHIIRPDAYLGTDGLEFIPSQMKDMLNKGFSRAEDYFRNLPA